MAASGADRQKYFTEFRRKANILLGEPEKNYLFNAMKEYSVHRSVDKLMRSLIICLDTPQKLDLLRDIRNLIAKSHVTVYDTMAPYSKMAHPVMLSVKSYHAQDTPRLRVHSDGMKHVDKRLRSDAKSATPSPGTVRRYTTGATERNSVQMNEVAQYKVSPGKSRERHHTQANGSVYSVDNKNNTFRVVSFNKDGHHEPNLGLTIKGGKENNMGVYVGSVRANSSAANLGLQEDDEIIEINGISFQHIALSSAGNLLATLNKLKLVIRTRSGSNVSNGLAELDPWNHSFSSHDSHSGSTQGSETARTTESGSQIEEARSDSSISQEIQTSSVEERKVRIVVDLSSTKDIGFNIRGGSEYGLGIYISSVDDNSLAQSCGLRVGDQIISANGLSFEKIKHKEAVDFLRSNKDIILSVKSVGKVPEARCFFSEFSWLTPEGVRIVDSNRNQLLSSSMPAGTLKAHRDVAIDPIDIMWNSTISDFASSKESIGIQTPDLIPADTIDLESRRRLEEDEIDGIPGEVYLPADDNGHVQAESMSISMQMSPEPEIMNMESLVVEDEFPQERTTGSVGSKHSNNSNEEHKKSWSNLSIGSNQTLEEGVDAYQRKKESRSKSFLQKQSEKLKEKFSFRRKSKSVDRDLLNSNIFERQRTSQEILIDIKEKAKQKLTVDEFASLMKHIKTYLEKGDIEVFVTNLLDTLDSPQKVHLLKDIREIVFPYDTSRYDVRVAKHEMEYLEELGDGTEPHIFEGELSDKPPRRTIVQAVQAKGGKFQLKSKEEAEQIEREKKEKSMKSSKIYFQTKSILEREKVIQKYDSFQNVPQPSSDYDVPIDQISEIASATSRDDVDALYAKVDKTAKRKNRNRIPSYEEPFDSFLSQTQTEDGQESTQTWTVGVEASESSAMSVISEGQERQTSVESQDDDDSVTEDDDGYALPIVIRPPSSRSGSAAENLIRRKVVVRIPKNRPNLGISISGGKGSIAQPDVRIEKIFPGGAAADIGGLMAGQQISSVDGESLNGVSHSEAVDIIRRVYHDKTKPNMEIEVFID